MALAATTLLAALCLGIPTAAQARTSCSYVAAPTNSLTVDVSGESDAVITRRGAEITVNESGDPLEPCAGGIPTVTNTDTIHIAFSGDDLPMAEVLLANEAVGTGRRHRERGRAGDRDPDHRRGHARRHRRHTARRRVRWGRGANPGLNLNRETAGDQDDDVVMLGKNAPLLFAVGAGANDTFTGDHITRSGCVYAEGGPGNDVITNPPGNVGAIFAAGAGNDVLTGSRLSDVLRGEGGNDRIVGGAGADNITGGPGRDRISGGIGRDFIKVRDTARDSVNCGDGRDRVNTDRRDRVNGCEAVNER